MNPQLLEIQKIPDKEQERLMRAAESYLVGKGWKFSQIERMTVGKLIKALLMHLLITEGKNG